MALEAVHLVPVRELQQPLCERVNSIGVIFPGQVLVDHDVALVHELHQTVELILLHHVAHVHAHRHVGIALLRVRDLVLVDELVELIADVRECNLVRVKLPPTVAVREEDNVAQLGVVEVLVSEMRLWGGRQRHRVVGVPRREQRLHVLRNLEQRTRRVFHRVGEKITLVRRVHLEQNVQAALLVEDDPLLVVAAQMCQRDGDALLLALVRGSHKVDEVLEHPPVNLLLQPLQGLVHAILAGLSFELAVHQPLHRALADDVGDVILVVRQSVQRERGVVLQVGLVRVQEVEKGSQSVGVADAHLVVLVLRKSTERKRRHLPQLTLGVVQHLDQRLHCAPLHDLDLILDVGVVRGRGELSEEERCLPPALVALRGEEANDRLQRPLVEHPSLDVVGRVHQVTNHPHSLVVDVWIAGSHHEDEHRKGALLDDLFLVLVVLERERPQRRGSRPLNLGVPRLQQRDERRDATLGPYPVLDRVVLVRKVGHRIRRPASHGRSHVTAHLGWVPLEKRDKAGEGPRVGDSVLVILLGREQADGVARLLFNVPDARCSVLADVLREGEQGHDSLHRIRANDLVHHFVLLLLGLGLGRGGILG